MVTVRDRSGRVKRLLLAAVVLLCGSCATSGYLLHIAGGEARILLSRRPLADALRDPGLDLQTQQRLRLIQRAAAESASLLGLVRDDQYREVAELPDEFRVWVLVLAEPDQLTPVTWRFPIVGEIPYLGFFDRDRAERMANDTFPDADRYLRTAAAFSTLGFFPDPVLPEFLQLPDEAVVNTVVHELVHATLYRTSETDWNETVAVALGDAGAEILLAGWGRDDLVASLRQRRQDRMQWARMISDTTVAMDAAYARIDSRDERLQVKQRLVDEFRARVGAADWHNPGYRRYAEFEVNHAFLLAQRTYLADPEFLDAWYQYARQDFANAVELLRRQEVGEDPLWSYPPGMPSRTPANSANASAPNRTTSAN